jgi:hypothetical protein
VTKRPVKTAVVVWWLLGASSGVILDFMSAPTWVFTPLTVATYIPVAVYLAASILLKLSTEMAVYNEAGR